MTHDLNIEKWIISKGGQELGISWFDIENKILVPEEFKKFEDWMRGQTCGCVDDSCKTTVVYTGDLRRWLAGLPNLD